VRLAILSLRTCADTIREDCFQAIEIRTHDVGAPIEDDPRQMLTYALAIEPRESGLKQRVVVMEFENFEKAVAAYNSAAYRAALKVLGSAADRDFRIVEGV